MVRPLLKFSSLGEWYSHGSRKPRERHQLSLIEGEPGEHHERKTGCGSGWVCRPGVVRGCVQEPVPHIFAHILMLAHRILAPVHIQ